MLHPHVRELPPLAKPHNIFESGLPKSIPPYRDPNHDYVRVRLLPKGELTQIDVEICDSVILLNKHRIVTLECCQGDDVPASDQQTQFAYILFHDPKRIPNSLAVAVFKAGGFLASRADCPFAALTSLGPPGRRDTPKVICTANKLFRYSLSAWFVQNANYKDIGPSFYDRLDANQRTGPLYLPGLPEPVAYTE